jgi:hypothetical protein
MQNQRHIPLQHLLTSIPLVLVGNHTQRLGVLSLGLVNHLQTNARLALGNDSDNLDSALLPGFNRCWFGARGRGDEDDAGLSVFEVEGDFGLRVGRVEGRGDGSGERYEQGFVYAGFRSAGRPMRTILNSRR